MQHASNGVAPAHVADNARTSRLGESLRDQFARSELALRERLTHHAGGYLDRDNLVQQGILVAYLQVMDYANDPASIGNLLNFASAVGLRALHAAGRSTRIERLTEYTAFPELFSTPYDPVQAEIESRELAEVIHAAIALLPAHYRAVIGLRFYEDYSFPEIAETLDTTEGAAKMTCRRALMQLRPMLVRAGYDMAL